MESTFAVQITHPHTCIRVDGIQLVIRPELDGAADPQVAVEAERLVPGGERASVWLEIEQAREIHAALISGNLPAAATDHTEDSIVATLTDGGLTITLLGVEDDVQEAVTVDFSVPAAYTPEVCSALAAAADHAEANRE
ncbi:hypothetical protein ACIQGT_14175 [Streptomyces sp. NPDC093108]|uniref:hypothetical protein n=1 Tax=unclassified Streptomyces TaxID=2593676 RepID=UPI0037F81082